MILKIKELNTQCLILRIDTGTYYIEIQETKTTNIGNKILPYNETEVLETYDSMDYTVKEVVSKLEEIYNTLKWDYNG